MPKIEKRDVLRVFRATLLGGVAVAVLHILWSSTLLSIIGGTVIYMLLINFAF